MLRLNGGESFASGCSRFHDHASNSYEPTSKIFVKVDFSSIETQLLAQLDTGSPYSMLEREVAESLGLLDGDGQQVRVDTRLGLCRGRLERASLTLVADVGDSLEVEAVFFVSTEWKGKTFLGYTGLLDHIRVALDPGTNLFYFGLLE